LAITLEQLWEQESFTPNDNQRRAILHTSGPLFLTAGPGSGKTRVLLWRTLNLIVFHDVRPAEIFLSTFTEKAAFQLKQGLLYLLGITTNHTGKAYDIGNMYIGTVHSLCQKMLSDRALSDERTRARRPMLLDELAQYFFVYHERNWRELLQVSGLSSTEAVNQYFGNTYKGQPSSSKHQAVVSCIQLFNRLSEECVLPAVAEARTSDPTLKALLRMYAAYCEMLNPVDSPPRMDFSLLQQRALERLNECTSACRVFRHVIIDEYQDTNSIQEKIFFTLAKGHRNICVVGDDDQALYRFRGATVENFVEFASRCEANLKVPPETIPLEKNYRSRKKIVDFYTAFIQTCDWRKKSGAGFYRISDKKIEANSTDDLPSVVATANVNSDATCKEIAELVKSLIDNQVVQDPNQVAFLFPTLKSTQVERMKTCLEQNDLLVYAPRAGRFVEVDEAVAVIGILIAIFGKPSRGTFSSLGYHEFHNWLDRCADEGKVILKKDPGLSRYVSDLRTEIATVLDDYRVFIGVAETHGWGMSDSYDIDLMKRKFYFAQGVSARAKKTLGSSYLERLIKGRAESGTPLSVRYVLNTTTSVDWSVLDLFYRITGFEHFVRMFELAESGKDEGPVCNLGLLSQYLARFMEEYSPMITASFLEGGAFQRSFFASYLYALFRLGESEYEDADDPYPKGRVPFLTVHQAKGLEFPVVVLGSPRKDDKGPQLVEVVVRSLVDREGEPLDRSSEFDIMRMFYVALSRAENLLVIAHPRGQGIRTHPSFAAMLNGTFPRVATLDHVGIPIAKPNVEELPRSYSYTGDYLSYQKCPRQYMVFRKYGFVASRSQTQFFGSLVHQTIEDLHHLLIAARENAKEVQA
jgi:DNA helicase-2/ATP-dependent DNA helicase PcrA